MPSRMKIVLVLGISALWAPGLAAAQAPAGGQGPLGNALNRGESTQAPNKSDLDASLENLRSDDVKIRLEAVKSLAGSKDEKATRALLEALADPEPEVRLKAIDIVGEMRASEATSPLVQILFLLESPGWLQQRALVSLGKIGDPRATRAITDFVQRSTDKDAIGTALFALGEIGDDKAIPELKVTQKSADPTLHRIATDAIAKIEARRIEPEVQVHALRPDPDQMQRPASAGVGAPVAY